MKMRKHTTVWNSICNKVVRDESLLKIYTHSLYCHEDDNVIDSFLKDLKDYILNFKL